MESDRNVWGRVKYWRSEQTKGFSNRWLCFFGLCNSPATFQTMMDNIFNDLITEGVVVVYLDDILIFTETLKEHQRVTLLGQLRNNLVEI